jgi:hypothetical protein
MRKKISISKQAIALLAIWAMLCNSLLPTIVFARASNDPFILATLCSSGDVKQISLDRFSPKQPAAPSLPGGIHHAHCPFCYASAHAALPPHPSESAFTVLRVERGISRLPATENIKQRGSSIAQPRGPPSFA